MLERVRFKRRKTGMLVALIKEPDKTPVEIGFVKATCIKDPAHRYFFWNKVYVSLDRLRIEDRDKSSICEILRRRVPLPGSMTDEMIFEDLLPGFQNQIHAAVAMPTGCSSRETARTGLN